IFSSFYIFTNKIIYQEVDKELSLHSHNLDQFGNVPTMVTVQLDQNGNVTKSSVDFNSSTMLFSNLFKIAQKNRSITFINQSMGNTPMRFLIKPTWTDDKLTEVLLVAHPIEAIQKSLNSLMSTLAFIFIIFILPVILGAIVFTQKIIKPISSVIQNMDDITTENLEMRLPNPKSNDEIEKLTLTFNNLLDRLHQSFKRERQFIEDIAHELKTPIATLKGGIELTLSKDRSNTEYKRTLKETLIDTDRISKLVSNLLDLAWVGMSQNTLNNKQFNLSEVTNDLAQIALKLGLQKNIVVNIDIDKNIKIYGDESKISRAILNLIDNAIKYTSCNKNVLISLKQLKRTIILTIRDEGVGISKSDLEHVFERFCRGSKTAKTLGSGLGLAIAEGIIKTHNGDIKIESKIGKGTIVKVILPI
ncbi:MAG: HAMP domain-containing sensor histidine kinase, partial [Microgenomates group bacterium]